MGAAPEAPRLARRNGSSGVVDPPDTRAEVPHALKILLVLGHPDVLDDALSNLAAFARGHDELDQASRAAGGSSDANEHGEVSRTAGT